MPRVRWFAVSVFGQDEVHHSVLDAQDVGRVVTDGRDNQYQLVRGGALGGRVEAAAGAVSRIGP